tara:strand:- start:49 stop:1209 length:1161 start_codon:yes stop_codon:yes gene_type:complete
MQLWRGITVRKLFVLLFFVYFSSNAYSELALSCYKSGPLELSPAQFEEGGYTFCNAGELVYQNLYNACENGDNIVAKIDGGICNSSGANLGPAYKAFRDDPSSCPPKAGVSVWTSVDQAPLIKDGEGCLAECVLVVDNDPNSPPIRCTYTGTEAQVDANDNIIPPQGYPAETDPEHCEVDNNSGVCLDSNHPDNATNGDGSQAEGCPDTRPQYGTVARSGKSYNVCVASGGGGDGITFSQDPGAPVNTGGSGTPSPGNDSDSGSSGGGSAAPSTGNTGGGSNDPSTWGDLGENDYYEPGQTGTGQELTYSNILTNFQFRVAESTVGSSWKNFFSASLTGACPTYSVSTWIFSITFDQWCSAMMPWGLIGGVIMACALFMGGRIAFT